ncbi:MAG: hypothetical protein RLO52_20165 [Sandaracinaceae bacterium]
MTARLWAFTVAAGFLAACTGATRHSCRTHQDCRGDDGVERGFCTDRGFCARECEEDLDCPCGSFCAEGCGICVRDDCANAATCFAENRGLTTAQGVLGACREVDCAARQDAGAEDSGTRLCDQEPSPLPMCVQPTRPRAGDAGAGGPGDVMDGGSDAGSGDASAADAGTAAEEDGGPSDGGTSDV